MAELTARPDKYVGSLLPEEKDHPNWTQEGELAISSSIFLKVAAALLKVPEERKIWFNEMEKRSTSFALPLHCVLSDCRIWRVPLSAVLSFREIEFLVLAIEEFLNVCHPNFAPWNVLGEDTEKYKKGLKEISLQMYEDTGRQPSHFDNGVVWMKAKMESNSRRGPFFRWFWDLPAWTAHAEFFRGSTGNGKGWAT